MEPEWEMRDVALFLSTTTRTVHEYIKSGALPSVDGYREKGRRRFEPEVVRAFKLHDPGVDLQALHRRCREERAEHDAREAERISAEIAERRARRKCVESIEAGGGR